MTTTTTTPFDTGRRYVDTLPDEPLPDGALAFARIATEVINELPQPAFPADPVSMAKVEKIAWRMMREEPKSVGDLGGIEPVIEMARCYFDMGRPEYDAVDVIMPAVTTCLYADGGAAINSAAVRDARGTLLSAGASTIACVAAWEVFQRTGRLDEDASRLIADAVIATAEALVPTDFAG